MDIVTDLEVECERGVEENGPRSWDDVEGAGDGVGGDAVEGSNDGID